MVCKWSLCRCRMVGRFELCLCETHIVSFLWWGDGILWHCGRTSCEEKVNLAWCNVGTTLCWLFFCLVVWCMKDCVEGHICRTRSL